MGEFKAAFRVAREAGDQVEIECPGGNRPSQLLIDKMDSLHKEEMRVSEEDVQKLGAPFDTRNEGLDAFIYPARGCGSGIVIIYSFESNALVEAKQLVTARLGLGKVSMRSSKALVSSSKPNRLSDTEMVFAEPGADKQMDLINQDKALCAARKPRGRLHAKSVVSVAPLNLTTASGMIVSVSKGHITQLHVDAIVNNANEKLENRGGLCYVIAKTAGSSLEQECKEYVCKNGLLTVSEVVPTSGGNLPCKSVLHAVGPRWKHYEDKALCEKVLGETVYNCLTKAHEMNITSIGIPIVSPGGHNIICNLVDFSGSNIDLFVV
jgi:O-acetyl-ADP-ribose deacetylase (regulator of RNase III)